MRDAIQRRVLAELEGTPQEGNEEATIDMANEIILGEPRDRRPDDQLDQIGANVAQGAFLTTDDCMGTANNNVQIQYRNAAEPVHPRPDGPIAEAGRDIALRTLHLDAAPFHATVDAEVYRMDAEGRPGWETAHLQEAAVNWRNHYNIGEPIPVRPHGAAGLTMPQFQQEYGPDAVARPVGAGLYMAV